MDNMTQKMQGLLMPKKKIHWVWKILSFAFFCIPVHGQEIIDENLETATFAGGCFWLVQHNFNQVDGVVSTKVGYTGGHKLDPCYEEVCSQETGHFEAVQVVYHSQKISYEELLDVYWKMIDPTRDDGQLEDYGPQYRPVIFYHNLYQKEAAERSKQALIQSKRFPQILVQILPETIFYIAEDHHQNYLDPCES
ncbi:MAG: peptide-methionine (S)-S-oxide reductase [Chlamydiae bacterium]|nr:MAG: peptide-methionine (S)-S-oxide reductase [Chlamydiota bacterium]